MDGTGTDEVATTMAGADNQLRRLEITPSFEHLDDVRAAVRTILDGADLVIDELYLVAVTEVVTNAIEEHHRFDTRATIEITVDVNRRAVEVTDRGNGYHPDEQSARRGIDDGGWGLELARAGAPHLSWRHNTDNGTTFTLPVPST